MNVIQTQRSVGKKQWAGRNEQQMPNLRIADQTG